MLNLNAPSKLSYTIHKSHLPLFKQTVKDSNSAATHRPLKRGDLNYLVVTIEFTGNIADQIKQQRLWRDNKPSSIFI